MALAAIVVIVAIALERKRARYTFSRFGKDDGCLSELFGELARSRSFVLQKNTAKYSNSCFRKGEGGKDGLDRTASHVPMVASAFSALTDASFRLGQHLPADHSFCHIEIRVMF